MSIFAWTGYLENQVEFKKKKKSRVCTEKHEEHFKATLGLCIPSQTLPSCPVMFRPVHPVCLAHAAPSLCNALSPLLSPSKALICFSAYFSVPQVEVIASSPFSQHVVSTWSTCIMSFIVIVCTWASPVMDCRLLDSTDCFLLISPLPPSVPQDALNPAHS